MIDLIYLRGRKLAKLNLEKEECLIWDFSWFHQHFQQSHFPANPKQQNYLSYCVQQTMRLYGLILSLVGTNSLSLSKTMNRRTVCFSPLIIPLATPALGGSPAFASTPKRYVVLGAGGKTGKKICRILNEKGFLVTAVTTDGRDLSLDGGQLPITYARGDVTDPASIQNLLSEHDVSGVVFAASASKKGGDAKAVDYLGVSNVAKATVENKVPRLVVISSGAITRPDSVGFKITELFGQIMSFKMLGENSLRDTYNASPDSTLSYTIVRPGGLSDKESIGARGVEISQGDVLSAEVTREDVAQTTVAALTTSKKVFRATVEVFGRSGESMFGAKTGALPLAKNLPTIPESLIHVTESDSYDELFNSILPDSKMATLGIVNNYEPDRSKLKI